ncbi:hypothetical protein PspLS_10881 [Pyricularia sp. CBS 133598]|nr:hypothetical protein PspLS_10881 [Pyricularia sp. CBS 133598]
MAGTATALGLISASITIAEVIKRKLRTVFSQCVPAADASQFERYVAALRTLGKDHKVELLMTAVLENVQDLANNSSGRAAAGDQLERLKAAIDALAALDQSVPDDMLESQPGARNLHTGRVDIKSAEGSAKQYNAKDSTKQYTATTMTISG